MIDKISHDRFAVRWDVLDFENIIVIDCGRLSYSV